MAHPFGDLLTIVYRLPIVNGQNFEPAVWRRERRRRAAPVGHHHVRQTRRLTRSSLIQDGADIGRLKVI
jgi:hypothetical protein